MEANETFDRSKPTITKIFEEYGGNIRDLGTYNGLKCGQVAEALLEAGRDGRAVVVPAEYAGWDRDSVFRKNGMEVPLDTSGRFMRYGPEVNIVPCGVSITEIKQNGLTPQKAMKEKLGSAGTRADLVEGAYRGFGWWNPRNRSHRIVPFDAPVEGRLFSELFGGEMAVKYQKADCYITVPSISRPDRKYEMNIRVLPVTAKNQDFLMEWLMTEADCMCEDSVFREIKGRMRGDTVFKYVNPEMAYCRHVLGALERARTQADAKPILAWLPQPTGLMNAWNTIKNKTVISYGDNHTKHRKPTRAETNILLGKMTGYAGPGEMFALD